MKETGILVHARHLAAVDWETLQWGIPSEGKLGSAPKLAELLLDEAEDRPVTTILLLTKCSEKDGLLEGAYTKQFLLDRYSKLDNFERIRNHPRFQTKVQKQSLYDRLQAIEVHPVALNTTQEVIFAAEIFAAKNIHYVIQLTNMSHGPRCIQEQSHARINGLIPNDQQWSVVVDDMCYSGTIPSDTVIFEPPHRGDDPLLNFQHDPGRVLRPFYAKLSSDQKKAFLTNTHDIMDHYLNDDTPLKPSDHKSQSFKDK